LFRQYLRQLSDGSGAAGIRTERYRLAALSAFTNLFNRMASLAVIGLSVLLTFPYLGAERFGLWATVGSLTTFAALMDLGLGTALINKIATASAVRDPTQLRTLIAAGVGLAVLLGLAATAIMLGLSVVLPWPSIIKVAPATQAELEHAVMLFSILLGLNIMASAIARVFHGLQRSFEPSCAGLAASAISCLLLWYASKAEAGIPTLLAATFGLQSVAPFVLLPILRRRRLLDIRLVAASVRAHWRELLGSGKLFLVLQVGYVLVVTVDPLIIASTLSVADVASYSVAQRIFQLVTIPLAVVNASLWAAYAHAKAMDDTRFVGLTAVASIGYTTLVAGLGSGVILLVSGDLVRLFTSNLLDLPFVLLALFAIWSVADAALGALTVYLNGCSILKPQIVAVALNCAVSIPLKIMLAIHYGIPGVLVGGIASYAIIHGLVYGLAYRRVIFVPILGR
jgi:O-antigen/teichoic acid export membrane protein